MAEPDGDNVNVVRIEEPENGAWICGPVQDGFNLLLPFCGKGENVLK